MKTIYLLCPWNIRTGGPEAIHQLSDALIGQGFDARTVYYDGGQVAALEQASTQDGYRFGARANPIEDYARYKANVADAVPNAEGAVVVLPEPLCHLAPKFDKADVIVWWLSVDNGLGALSKVNLNRLRGAVDHVAQSRYAAHFIEALQLPFAGMLSDYTVDLTEYATLLPPAQRRKLVAYNATPHKVIADWPAIKVEIAKLDPEIECVPVRGTRREVAELFARARVYVDLGTFPGKDRMPREAASMNCRPLVLAAGAGGVDLIDWATDGLGLPGRIAREVAKQDEWNWAAGYAGERDTFFEQVQDVFSEL